MKGGEFSGSPTFLLMETKTKDFLIRWRICLN